MKTILLICIIIVLLFSSGIIYLEVTQEKEANKICADLGYQFYESKYNSITCIDLNHTLKYFPR